MNGQKSGGLRSILNTILEGADAQPIAIQRRCQGISPHRAWLYGAIQRVVADRLGDGRRWEMGGSL